MSNPSQLYLLADHIKLSLLERQRAISLNLEPSSRDGHISRSLDQMRDAIAAVEGDSTIAQNDGDSSRAVDLRETAQSLRTQYDELTSQFQGFTATSTSTLTKPNDPSLSSTSSQAKDHRPRLPSSSSFKRSNTGSPNPFKSVRFRDNPDAEDDANRAALFPYRDDPLQEERSDSSQTDNQQIHAHHRNVLQQQDEQLDRLGESIGRQRDLSIQIGDELDDQIQMLDDVEGHVDRHQGRLDGARRQLDRVYRRGKENWGCMIISILVLILVILIIVLKN